jgi:hypothetical protein
MSQLLMIVTLSVLATFGPILIPLSVMVMHLIARSVRKLGGIGGGISPRRLAPSGAA